MISDLPFSSVELSQTYCFSAGLISPSGQVVAVVCWESAGAVCWDPPHFFPCSAVKLLLDYTGSAVKRRWMVRRTKPHIEGLSCNFHTCHILQQWVETTPRATFNGNSRHTQHWICGRLHNTFCMFSLEVKGHHLHPPQDLNLQLLSYLHKFGSTGWI